MNDPVLFFESLSEAEREVLNYLLVWGNSFNSLYFTQSTIARGIGRSRGHVNRALYIFESCGLIASNYRHKTSNLYKISVWFQDIKVREKLAYLFKAFRWFPIALLATQFTNANPPLFSGSVTQEVKYLYNNINLIHPKKNIVDNMYRSGAKATESSFKSGREVLKSIFNKHLPPDDPWQREKSPSQNSIQPNISKPVAYQPSRRHETMSREDSIRQKARSDDRSEALQSRSGNGYVWSKTFAQEWVIAKDREGL